MLLQYAVLTAPSTDKTLLSASYSLLFRQQINAENRPRADISYTFVAQEVTKKGDVCKHVGYAENENGLSPCEWISYNQSPTS